VIQEMATDQQEKNKKKLILSGLFFVSLWLFLSNSSPFRVKYQELFPDMPKIEVDLSNDIFTGFAILFPFLSLIALNLLIFFYYSNLITKKSTRRFLKILVIFVLLFFFYLILITTTDPITGPAPTNSTTTTITTTTTMETTVIPSETSIPTTTTETEVFVPPSITPPSWLQFVVDFLAQNLLYIVVVIGVSYVIIKNMKPSVPYELKEAKKIVKSKYKELKFRDKPRKHIITSYLYASKILEKLGANNDFSLTPIEFSDDVKHKFKDRKSYWNELPELTYWYEVARFSDENIPDTAIKEVDDAIQRLHGIVNKIYNKNIENENKE
jgi:hypothetical protein